MSLTEREQLLRAERAAEWALRLRRGGVEDRKAFARWLRQSPQHVEDMLREAELDFVLTHVDPRRKIDIDALMAKHRRNVVTIRPGTVPPVWRRSDGPAHRRLDVRRWGTITALGAALCAGVIALVNGFLLDYRITTKPGEWRNITLEDRAIVHIGPRTRLRVKYDNDSRAVFLDQGEALFEVTRDAARPFVVHSGAGFARALGTRFAVARSRDDILITVSEGLVVVGANMAEPPAGAPYDGGSVQLSAGQQVAVSRGHLGAVRRVDTTDELAWVQKRLIFRTETIGQAIEEFNRLNRLQIRIDDAAVASRPIRGMFDADDPEGFAGVAAAITDGATVQRSSEELRLTFRGEAHDE